MNKQNRLKYDFFKSGIFQATWRCWIFALTWTAMLFIFIPQILADPLSNVGIYFYSSETNINNFKSLKMEFDDYLSNFGPYTFQPFNDRKTFENEIRQSKNCYVILSSWHFQRIHERFQLIPLMTGIRNNSRYQRRVLVSIVNHTKEDMFKRPRIASASSITHTRSMLGNMLNENGQVDRFKILKVPKDMDAVMSVGFNVSHSALITRNSFDNFKDFNPGLYSEMSVIAESQPTLLLIFGAKQPHMPEMEKLIDIIQKMANDPDGKKRIQMLNLTGWQRIDSHDRSFLDAGQN